MSAATFSYAQAAKGVAGTPAPAKPATQDQENTDAKAEEQSNAAPAEPATATATATATETEAPQDAEKVAPADNKASEFTTVTSKHTARSKAAHSRNSSPSVRSGNIPSKEGDSSNTPNGTQEAATDKQSQSDSKTEKSDNGSENPKEKSEKPEKNAQPPKELKAAPLPPVNIWQQRREAQEAKTKTTPIPPASKTASGKQEDNQQENSKSGSKKKSENENSKGNKRDNGGKNKDGALPPVEDAISWPTPEVAVGEEKKKAQEKTDKTEKSEKSPTIRSHGKEKWIPVEHVPTAVFNTPLPTSGNRTGRKPARGGPRSGSHAANGAHEKAATGQSPQNQGPKQSPGDRGRNEAGPNRTTSLPAQTRRSTSTDVTTAEGRKAQAGERKNTPRGSEETAPAPNGKQVNGNENYTRPQREGKQFTKSNDARNNNKAQLGVDSQAAARNNDRRFESGSKSADVNREQPSFQDFNRERGDSRPDRVGRPGRGRGGAYSSFGGQNAHQYGNIQNNSFVPNKPYYQDRQRSQHGLTNGSHQGNRLPLRSPSLTASGNPYDAYPVPSNINTMYSYQAVNAGPMSAMPYQPYMEPYSLVSMLTVQLDYYFSVDNMCKDMFLRKNMDSQGFVPLSVIANFKRVKSLAEDFELIRHVARTLRNAEYIACEDGVDRLRPRDNWAQWVLPIDQREKSAQNDGPTPARFPPKNNENVPFGNYSEGSVNGSLHPGSQQFIPNGTARFNQTSLSSTAPEFLPSHPSSVAPTEISNVGSPKDSPPQSEARDDLADLATPKDSSDFPKKAFIDNKPARGLDSQSTMTPISYTGSNEQQHGPYSWQRKLRHNDFRPYNQYRNQHTQQPYESKGKGKSQHRKKQYANKMTEEDPEVEDLDNSRRQAYASPPYTYWILCLKNSFSLNLYNDFRRIAIDDLHSRHVNNGLHALIEYYRWALYSERRIETPVIEDLIHLSHRLTPDYDSQMYDVLERALESGQMENHNYDRTYAAFAAVFGENWDNWPAPAVEITDW